MDKKTYYRAVSALFTLIAILHALRVYNGWEAEIGGAMISMWMSWVALALAGYLAVRGWQFAGKR